MSDKEGLVVAGLGDPRPFRVVAADVRRILGRRIAAERDTKTHCENLRWCWGIPDLTPQRQLKSIERYPETVTSAATESGARDGVVIEPLKRYVFLVSLFQGISMLAKLTSKNQLTLPKAVIADFQGLEYFDVTKENGRIVLTPVRVNRADAVRAKLAELGMSETDVADAVAWARQRK